MRLHHHQVEARLDPRGMDAHTSESHLNDAVEAQNALIHRQAEGRVDLPGMDGRKLGSHLSSLSWLDQAWLELQLVVQ